MFDLGILPLYRIFIRINYRMMAGGRAQISFGWRLDLQRKPIW